MGGVIAVPQVNAIDEPIFGISQALALSKETEYLLLQKYVSAYEAVEDEMEDCVTAQFLLQFIEIQRKAVGLYGDLISRLELNPSDLLEFDEYLSEK
jgi:ferritin